MPQAWILKEQGLMFLRPDAWGGMEEATLALCLGTSLKRFGEETKCATINCKT